MGMTNATNTFAARSAFNLTAAQLAVAETVYAAEYASHLPVATAYCRDAHDARQEAARMAYRSAYRAAVGKRLDACCI